MQAYYNTPVKIGYVFLLIGSLILHHIRSYLLLQIIIFSSAQPNENFHTGSCGYANNSILTSIFKNFKKLNLCPVSIKYSLQDLSENFLTSVAKEACYNNNNTAVRVDCISVVCYDPKGLTEEASTFRDPTKVPHTLTLSTPELSEGSVGGKRLAKTWSQSKKLRWAIPDDHIAQNRLFCYNESLTASRKIVSLYEKYRSDSSAVTGYYVSIFRRAVIHQSGQVGTHCSMFKGIEGCETRFEITATWWNTCHTLLASLGIDWDTFWFGGEGSGNSSYIQRESVSEPLRGQMSMEEILRECMFSSDSARAQFLPPLRFPPYYDQVLVINGYFDSNYHHFLIDSLTRISRHVEFLHANPQVKIHIRATEHSVAGKMRENGQKSEIEIQRIMKEAEVMREKIFRILGISGDRLIFGTVRAGVVYMPRLSRCYFAIANPLEIRLLARRLLKGSKRRLRLSRAGQLPEQPNYKISENPSGKFDYGVVDLKRDMYTFSGDELYRTQLVAHSGVGFRPSEPTAPPLDLMRKRMIVLQRHSLLYRAGNWRDWHDDIFNAICSALALVFVNHTVVAVRSNDPHYANCLECLIWQFSHADIVVGAHGAGLTNMIFMPPGSVVIETVGVWDGRMLPVCGYTGVLCAVNGHHHYIYYYDWDNRKRLLTNPHLNILQPMKLATESFDFYRNVRAKVYH